MWLLAAVMLYIFENNTGTRALLFASVFLPLLSIFSAVISAKKLMLSLYAPQACEKNSAAGCAVSAAKLLPGALAVVTVETKNRLTGDRTALELAVPSFAAGKKFFLTAAHCGTIDISVTECYAQDLFGLIRTAPVRGEDKCITVLPKLFSPKVSLAQSAAASSDAEQSPSARPGFDPSETFAIREYIPGDPVRQIHWKLSQKTGVTMFRETGLPLAGQTLLLLDTCVPDGNIDAAAMSAAVETLLSLSGALTADGISHTVGYMNHIFCELELCEVLTQQEYVALSEQVLAVRSASHPEGVCSHFRKCCDAVYAHTVVCAPDLPADISSICAGSRVTLLIPAGKSFSGAPGDVHVQPYSTESMCEELSYIVI